MFFKKKTSGRPPSEGGRGTRLAPSIIGADVVIQGNIVTGGELQVEGTIQGDVRAAAIVVGPQGSVHGEIAGEDVVIRGRVIGPIRGIRVQVFASAHVDGDIVHDSLAVETGAFCQGNIRRSEEPLAQEPHVQGNAAPPPPQQHHEVEAPHEDEEDPRRPQRRPIMLRSRAAE